MDVEIARLAADSSINIAVQNLVCSMADRQEDSFTWRDWHPALVITSTAAASLFVALVSQQRIHALNWAREVARTKIEKSEKALALIREIYFGDYKAEMQLRVLVQAHFPACFRPLDRLGNAIDNCVSHEESISYSRTPESEDQISTGDEEHPVYDELTAAAQELERRIVEEISELTKSKPNFLKRLRRQFPKGRTG